MNGRARTLCSLVTVILMSGAMVGCSGRPQTSPDAPGSTTASGSVSPTSPGTSGSSTPSPTAPAALEQLDVRLEPVARGFDRPLFVTNAADRSGRLFVVEQAGRVRVVRDGRVLPRAFLDVSHRISSGGERGLLGMAFAPDYATSGKLYVNYTNRAGDTIVARFVADTPSSDTPKLAGPTTVFKQKQPYANHNGGCLMFAPDGKLWVGMGDGGSAGDPGNRARNPKVLLGKLLALDVNGSGKAKVTVVAKGLRNPWRFSFDAKNDDVWIGDVGQNAWEEVDVVPFDKMQGKDFGWHLWEGNHSYPPGTSHSRSGLTFPAFEYSHSEGESITGGFVYRGSAYPALDGVYFYGDFVNKWIGAARMNADGTVTHNKVLPDPGVTPSSFGVDEAGELYVCDYGGALVQVTAR